MEQSFWNGPEGKGGCVCPVGSRGRLAGETAYISELPPSLWRTSPLSLVGWLSLNSRWPVGTWPWPAPSRNPAGGEQPDRPHVQVHDRWGGHRPCAVTSALGRPPCHAPRQCPPPPAGLRPCRSQAVLGRPPSSISRLSVTVTDRGFSLSPAPHFQVTPFFL